MGAGIHHCSETILAREASYCAIEICISSLRYPLSNGAKCLFEPSDCVLEHGWGEIVRVTLLLKTKRVKQLFTESGSHIPQLLLGRRFDKRQPHATNVPEQGRML